MRTIAVMLNTIDPFFFPSEAVRECLFPVQEGSPLERLGKQKLGADHIVTFHAKEQTATLEDALEQSDLGEQLKHAGVTHVVMPHRASESVHRWATRNRVVVIAPPFALQRDLEYKITFDADLQRHCIPAPRTVDRNAVAHEVGPLVAQESGSYGLFGTRFFTNGKAFIDDPMSRGTDILVRAYEEGLPVGISMLIDEQGNYGISAMRRQCFIYHDGFPSQFTGVQWLPYSFFDKPTISAVEKTMDSLRTLLESKRFKGLANFDLLLGAGTCKVLECNPRLSSATAHIFGHHTLMSMRDPWTFFVNACTGLRNEDIHGGSVPESEYAGALLDIDAEGTVEMKAIPEVGEHDGYWLFHELFPGTRTVTADTVCTVLSDNPLFDFHTGGFNAEGETLYNSLKKQYIRSESHR